MVFFDINFFTANLYFSKIYDVRLKLLKWLKSSFEVIEKIAKKMLIKFNKYWDVRIILMITIGVFYFF